MCARQGCEFVLHFLFLNSNHHTIIESDVARYEGVLQLRGIFSTIVEEFFFRKLVISLDLS